MNATQTKTTISTNGIKEYKAIDAYRPNGKKWIVPMVTVQDKRGGEITRPVYTPEVFVPSDETNCPCRFYVIVTFESGAVKTVSRMQFSEAYGFDPFEATQIENLKPGYYIIKRDSEGNIEEIIKTFKDFYNKYVEKSWQPGAEVEMLWKERDGYINQLLTFHEMRVTECIAPGKPLCDIRKAFEKKCGLLKFD